MRYATGEEVRLWDRVEAWSGNRGFVIFSIDTNEYPAQHPRESWSYLGQGVMLDTEQAGWIHMSESDEDMTLLRRGEAPSPEEWADLRRAQFARAAGEWHSGAGPSVQIGYVNVHGQICIGNRGVAGTDHLQLAYQVECGLCGNEYGANGSDLHERRCPACQGGAPGIGY